MPCTGSSRGRPSPPSRRWHDRRVLWGLTGALGAAVAYGSATILQAIGVRRMATAEPGSSLLVRARLGRLYVVGLVLDGNVRDDE